MCDSGALIIKDKYDFAHILSFSIFPPQLAAISHCSRPSYMIERVADNQIVRIWLNKNRFLLMKMKRSLLVYFWHLSWEIAVSVKIFCKSFYWTNSGFWRILLGTGSLWHIYLVISKHSRYSTGTRFCFINDEVSTRFTDCNENTVLLH